MSRQGLRSTWWALVGCLVFWVLVAWCAITLKGRDERLQSDLAVARHQLAAARKVVPQVDSIFVRDTIRVIQTRTQYRVVRDSVLAAVEPASAADTAVRIVTAACDTALAAADSARASAVQAIVARDTVILYSDSLRTLEHKERPSRLRRWATTAKHVAIGAATGALAVAVYVVAHQ